MFDNGKEKNIRGYRLQSSAIDNIFLFLFFSLMSIKKALAWTKQKIVATVALSVLGIASFGTGAMGMYQAVTESPNAVAFVTSAVDSAISTFEVPKASALTASGGVIIVEAADTTIANDASTKNLQSMFEIIKFLPTMALISGGMYVLSAVMNILPKGRAAV